MSSSTASDRVAALKARVAAAIGSSQQEKGLAIPLHPVLQDLDASSKTPIVKPQLDQSRAIKNPYLPDTSESNSQSYRGPRHLIFNQKGRYIKQANVLRRQAALEEIKKRVAEQTRKVGIDEVPSEKNYVIEPPPSIEWFDQAYLVEGATSYNDELQTVHAGTEDSIITDLIQHPVPIQPPQDRLVAEIKPMFLTKNEQKKIRRQRRMALLKETQAKIRLGLIPAPEPKVKKSNLMRVLGEEAVLDPTAVEARVNRQIEERHKQHINDNETRKLSKEQRHEKLVQNQEKDAAKGIHVLVFSISDLSNGQHQYKINVNAEQLALTGVCITHPKVNLIIVEGGEHSIRKYKRLMLFRIDWGQIRCQMIFEGEAKTRVFRQWSSRKFEAGRDCYNFLSKVKMENLWTQALNSV